MWYRITCHCSISLSVSVFVSVSVVVDEVDGGRFNSWKNWCRKRVLCKEQVNGVGADVGVDVGVDVWSVHLPVKTGRTTTAWPDAAV